MSDYLGVIAGRLRDREDLKVLLLMHATVPREEIWRPFRRTHEVRWHERYHYNLAAEGRQELSSYILCATSGPSWPSLSHSL